MKGILVLLTVLLFTACKSPGNKQAPPFSAEGLEKRLDLYMKASKELNFEKILDYTYPKLFELASRSSLYDEMESSFKNDEVTIALDSLRIIKQHPVFTTRDGSFAKVSYSMLMIMQLTDTATSAEQYDMIRENLTREYGEMNIDLDQEKAIIRIRSVSDLLAIKDKYAKDWTFIGLEKDEEITRKLLSKEVLEKLANYN